MKAKWQYKNKNEQLILFFNGWAMDDLMIQHLESKSFDVCMFHNYNDITFNISTIKNYKFCHIIAWSVGISVANAFYEIYKPLCEKKIAIAGSPFPSDNNFGIPENIFNTTQQNLTEKNLIKFQRRTCGNSSVYKKFQDRFNTQDIENKKEELKYIQFLSQKYREQLMPWDKAIICNEDLIFPPENLKKYWSSKTEVKFINSPHYPFLFWNSWDDIIKL